MQFIIGNDTPVNGRLWALDENDNLLKYDTVEEAVDFLEENEANPSEWYIHITDINKQDSCKYCKHDE